MIRPEIINDLFCLLFNSLEFSLLNVYFKLQYHTININVIENVASDVYYLIVKRFHQNTILWSNLCGIQIKYELMSTA